MEKITAFIKKYKEIISYLFWGGMTTVVSWGSYSLFALVFQNQISMLRLWGMEMSIAILVSNILSWVCAFLFAFVANKLWVFESKSWKAEICLPEFGKFFSARALTGVMEIILVPLLVSLGLDRTILGIEGMAAKVFVSVTVVILNYVFSKLFIFKNKEKRSGF